MNAVEIEEAATAVAEQPFDVAECPFAFLPAFGVKETTLHVGAPAVPNARAKSN